MDFAAVAESFLEGRDRSADLLRVFIIIVSSCWAAYVCVFLLKSPMNLMKIKYMTRKAISVREIEANVVARGLKMLFTWWIEKREKWA
ncbi:hypothetical protein PRIPAC_97696 [Pristionchus pacificus]|uniref:Uncharacterized protein n=1 Tax=Pristionchus pacificus TaxID=54126 RepID=A0A2A6B3A5_PRIPA|nr:hypothetical protein PRIPAC_97696 [Pristionchus pacificus]|eukprot:PDM60357.1 hypothetical protein PRIPAC_54182 [Pristionchus pacificus]